MTNYLNRAASGKRSFALLLGAVLLLLPGLLLAWTLPAAAADSCDMPAVQIEQPGFQPQTLVAVLTLAADRQTAVAAAEDAEQSTAAAAASAAEQSAADKNSKQEQELLDNYHNSLPLYSLIITLAAAVVLGVAIWSEKRKNKKHKF